MRTKIIICLVASVLLLAVSLSAELETTNTCQEDLECTTVCEPYDLNCYCSETEICVLTEVCSTDADCSFCDELDLSCFCDIDNTCSEVVAETTDNTTETAPDTAVSEEVQQQVQGLQQQLEALEVSSLSLEQRLQLVEESLRSIDQQLRGVSSDLSTVEDTVQQNVNTVATGLAGLQQTVDITQQELDVVEEKVEKEQAFTTFLTWTFFILLIIAAALGTIYYINRKKPQEVSSEILDYITSHIKQGKKFPQIKQVLLQAGWSDEDIENAYKQTMKRNYQSYRQQQGQPLPETSGSDTRTKSIVIGVIGLVVVVGLFFLLKAASGQAIRIQMDDSGEAQILCFAPHIPKDSGCCLDENENGFCDFEEDRLLNRPEEDAAICQDSIECTAGKSCIDGKCLSLDQLYQTTQCRHRCNLESVRVETSDGEAYLVGPNLGGYTAAGGIEWKVKAIPEYCQTAELKVPIQIIKKSSGKIINDYITMLGQGEKSAVITHPASKKVQFQLEVVDVTESCN
ncbi:hypothetical protein COV20_06150 [Candidatus Woesearchaeota archaeon CG10_big_fil_rev_8_21_14_0_10_45_16]|nr:MAG: hypothetical protein COV20_06150 [Candidatus Woesearchaeota archaeon CG10_big_fil_rev_8_21_14_0_10_45_16]